MANETAVPASNEARIVVDVSLDLKRRLYSSLSLDGLTMKDWFVEQAESYLEKRAKRKTKRVKK